MKSIIRLVIVVVASIGIVTGSAGAASARDLPDVDPIESQCPPGTTHRILFVCYGW